MQQWKNSILFILLGLISTLLYSCSNTEQAVNHILQQLPEKTQQAIVVLSKSWSSSDGQLQRYEKSQGKWQPIGQAFAVKLGRNGLAWGRGLHSLEGLSSFKQEGDGKAPAGVFKLGSSFGYSAEALSGQRYPYKQATERDYYIDDVNSPDYNRWVHIDSDVSNTPKAYWQSFERMRRDDGLYALGLEVEHNKSPIEKMAGSAIFMHIWKDKTTSTSGCTAMDKGNLISLLKWLDADKQPLLVQVPVDRLNSIKLN